MRRILTFLLIFIAALLVPYVLSESDEKSGAADLPRILEKTAEYCERLDKIALHFICNEQIKERFYWGRFSGQNTYVYDYQLIRKDKAIEEQRVLIEENGQEKREESAELRTQRFQHEYVIFGPIGLLSKSRQRLHDYALKRTEKHKGDKCYVIEVFPKPHTKTGGLFGRAWVRQDDCSIMKIEWNQQSMENIEKIEEYARRLGARPKITFASEYAFEKNGIRFPSKYTVKEEYVRRTRVKISEMAIVYKDYKFFIVETEVKIK
jgi:hypothetical protein